MAKKVPKERLILVHGDLVDDEEIKKVVTSPKNASSFQRDHRR